MVYLRTADGRFIAATSIVRLADRRAESKCWVAVRGDGEQVELARFFSAPGRIERDLPHLLPERPGSACTAEACCAP